MPKVNRNEYNNTSYSNGGEFKQFQPGAYVGRIQAVRTEWEEMDWSAGQRVKRTAETDDAVMFVFDVDEGEFEGEFSREFYMDGDRLDPSKDFMHWVRYSWGDLRDLKRFDDVLRESNPGFDPEAAFDADRWELYVGRLFGFVADGTVKTNDRGYDQWRCNVKPWKVRTVDQIRKGDHPEPRVTDKRTKVDTDTSTAATAPAAYKTDDVPF